MKKNLIKVILLIILTIFLTGCGEDSTTENTELTGNPINVTYITSVSGLSFGVPTEDLEAAIVSMNGALNETNIISGFDNPKVHYIISQPQWYRQTDESTYDYQAYNMENMMSLKYVNNDMTMKNILNNLVDRQDSSVLDFQKAEQEDITVCFSPVNYVKAGEATSEQQMYTGGLYLIEKNGCQYAVLYGFSEDKYRAEMLNQLIGTITLIDAPSSIFSEENLNDPVSICNGTLRTNPSLATIYNGEDSFLCGNTTIKASVVDTGIQDSLTIENVSDYLRSLGRTIYKTNITDETGKTWVGKLILTNDQGFQYCYATEINNNIIMYTAVIDNGIGTDTIKNAIESLVIHTTINVTPEPELNIPDNTEETTESLSQENTAEATETSTEGSTESSSTTNTTGQPFVPEQTTEETFILEWN